MNTKKEDIEAFEEELKDLREELKITDEELEVLKEEEKQRIKKYEEIHEKGQFIHEEDGFGVCNRVRDFYYLYDNKIYKVEKMYIKDVQHIQPEEDYVIRLKEAIEKDNFDDVHEFKDFLKRLNDAPEIEHIYELQEVNLFNLSKSVVPALLKLNILKSKENEREELFKKIKELLESKDVKDNKITVRANLHTCINGLTLLTHMNVEDLLIRNERSKAIKNKNSHISMIMDSEDMGIGHQVIDEYRQVFKIYSGSNGKNFIDITILFISTEHKHPFIIGSLKD